MSDNQNITSAKAFSGAMTLEMSDAEIKTAYELLTRIKRRHTEYFQKKYPFHGWEMEDMLTLLSQFEDEVKTELAEKCNVLATVDTVPLLEGQPMAVELLGKLPGDYIHTHGMDHERKEWEVKRTRKDEAYKGEKS